MEPNNNPTPNPETHDTSIAPDETTAPSVTSSTADQPASPASPAPNAAVSKKLLWGVLAGLGLLLVILIVLVVLLLGKKDDTTAPTANNSSNNASTASNDDSSDTKKVIRTLDTKDDKVKFVLYEPRQTGSNTTINYSLKYDCPGCNDKKYVNMGAAVGYGYTTKSKVYLLDENVGQKYNPIVDEDDKMLMTPSCSGYVSPGGKVDCFYAFTKVPSGTKVSVVIDSLKIDDVTVK